MMDDVIILFDRAYREVARRSFVAGLDEIRGRMAVMSKMARLAGIYQAARARERRRATRAGRFLIPNIWELRRRGESIAECPAFERLCNEVIGWLGRKFPLLEDHVLMQWTDDQEESLLIYVCNPGIDLCWDEAADLFEQPDNYDRAYGLMLLPIYTVHFGQFVADDQEYPLFWEPAANWFGWGVELPWWLWLPGNLWSVDNGKFYRLLEKAGLPSVADTFRMAWHDTGTFFLDLEHDHGAYGNDDPTVHEFTPQNIEKLSRFWREAKPVCDRGYAACAQVIEHPELYRTIIGLLGRCITPADSGRTVKELKAAAAAIRRQAATNPQHNEEEQDESQ